LAQTGELLDRWPRDENALILRAAALLFGPEVDAAEAGRLLRRLPRARRQEPDVEALDLWKDYRHGFSFMPTIRDRLHIGRARELLSANPVDPIANLVAGLLRVEEQRYLDNAVRLVSPMGEEGVSNQLFYEAKAEIDPSTGRIAFNTNHSGAPDINVVRDDAPLKEVTGEAVMYLIRAASSGPVHSVAVRHLTEAAIRGGRVRDAEMLLSEYTSRYPETVEGFVYLGLIRFMLQKDDLAADAFNKALAGMDEDTRFPWLYPGSVVSTDLIPDFKEVGPAGMDDYWIRQDREWSRPGNERLVEHMGRMAYADLIWGRDGIDLKGWEVEPGQVLVRYGFPLDRLQFQTSTQGGDRYYIMHYGSRYWIFQDLVKAGKPIFYSPPADFFQGGRAVPGDDWALIAKEQFRDNPLESDLDDTGRIDMLLLPSVFENEAGRVVVTPVCVRGATFVRGDELQQYVRRTGGPIPSTDGTISLQTLRTCPSALSEIEIDEKAYQVSLEIRKGEFWSVGRFDLDAVDGSQGLRTSDIMLASVIEESLPERETPEGMWERNDLWIKPVAEARYKRGQFIHVYAEAYGIDSREGGGLTIQAVLAEGGTDDVPSSRLGRLFGGRDDTIVSVSFDDDIQSNSHGRSLALETGDLAPGLYTLALRYTEQSTGRQAVTRRELRID
jgi:GWxTD domain-containing protein